MKREELEKLSREELIEIILILQDTVAALAAKVSGLEMRLNMNSANSSMPPSSDKWKRPQSGRKKSGKTPGGQDGHKGHGFKIEHEPDEINLVEPAACENCGLDLNLIKADGSVSDSRYKVDVEIRTIVTRYDQLKVTCPDCKTVNIGKFPEGINSRMQYGEGVKAISVLFTNYAMVGYDKTQKILNDVFGIPIGVGTIVNHVKGFAKNSEPFLDEIAATLKKSAVLNCDETSVRVNGKKQWLHTASNREATYNTVHPSRGAIGTDDNGVLKDFKGTAVHDCWKPYFSYKNCTHALCNAHLLRELQGVIDNANQLWASQMQGLLREMKATVDRYKSKSDDKEGLSAYYNKKFAEAYERIVRIGEEENPYEEGQRKRGKARCLLERFIAYQQEICRFSKDFQVPFDNNQAERDIRNSKVKQKVSGGFRSDDGARNFGKTSSIIGTALKQGISAFSAVSGIISGTLASCFRQGLVTE